MGPVEWGLFVSIPYRKYKKDIALSDEAKDILFPSLIGSIKRNLRFLAIMEV